MTLGKCAGASIIIIYSNLKKTGLSTFKHLMICSSVFFLFSVYANYVFRSLVITPLPSFIINGLIPRVHAFSFSWGKHVPLIP